MIKFFQWFMLKSVFFQPTPPSQVIFSQASELLERQSSMASSTECVSGPGNDVSTEQSKHDTTDTEQRFGMYMRDFDFLEYELESLEGESVDNFNWGVSVIGNRKVEYLTLAKRCGDPALPILMES